MCDEYGLFFQRCRHCWFIRCGCRCCLSAIVAVSIVRWRWQGCNQQRKQRATHTNNESENSSQINYNCGSGDEILINKPEIICKLSIPYLWSSKVVRQKEHGTITYETELFLRWAKPYHWKYPPQSVNNKMGWITLYLPHKVEWITSLKIFLSLNIVQAGHKNVSIN